MNKSDSTENLPGEDEIQVGVTKNYHPWFVHDFPDWELLEFRCGSESLVEPTIKHLVSHFWHPWIIDNMGGMSGVMYRPIGIDCNWEDVRDGTWRRTDL